MTGIVTIAHLTDVHLGPIEGFTPRHWNLKRLTGYINWRRHRRHHHTRSMLDRLVADLHAQAPDHIAVTGDLANIGLPRELANALGWLEGLGPPERVSVIPGNHDIYTHVGTDAGTRRWARYMESDRQGAGYAPGASAGGGAFPYVRMVGRVALIGLNSALPRPPLIAAGHLGAGQLAALRGILDRLGAAGLFRLVMIHHPPLPGQADHWRGLRDAAALADVLGRHGAELVIHGHNHQNMLAWHPQPGGRTAIVGAPSASAAAPFRSEQLARYNLYRIAGPPWQLEMIGRGAGEPEGRIIELERRVLAGEPGKQ